MSKCELTFNYLDEKQSAKTTITDALKENNGEISFENDEGQFTLKTQMGKVAGDVQLKDESMLVTITKKPAFLPCKAIEKVISGYMVE